MEASKTRTFRSPQPVASRCPTALQQSAVTAFPWSSSRASTFPSADHRITEPSHEPLARVVPSALQSTATTGSSWPCKVPIAFPSASQSRTVPSHEALAKTGR